MGTLTNTGRSYLQDLASGTGGTYLPAPSNSQIDAAYSQVRNLLSNEYLLTFPSSISDCGSAQTGRAGDEPGIDEHAVCALTPTAENPGGGSGNNGGGGGGSAVGWPELVGGVVLLAIARRRIGTRRSCGHGRGPPGGVRNGTTKNSGTPAMRRRANWMAWLIAPAHRSVMQFFLPAALALALPAGCVAHDLVPLRDAILGLTFVAVLSLGIAHAAEVEDERRYTRRLFAQAHRLLRLRPRPE